MANKEFENELPIRIIPLPDYWYLLAEIEQIMPQGIIRRRSVSIRKWGTDYSFGHLAMEGPQPDTILDPQPPGGFVPIIHVFDLMPCDQNIWVPYFDEVWGNWWNGLKKKREHAGNPPRILPLPNF